MTCFDCHTHTYFSNHGTGTVAELVSAAVDCGMSLIALTEHLPLPPEANPDGTFAMDADKLEAYIGSVQRAQEAYPEIEIICGIEIDWRTGAEQYILKTLAEASAPFELRLGSVHMFTDAQGACAWAFDHPAHINGWYERGEEQVWRSYLELWLEALESRVSFDIMAHPDLPKRLGFKPAFDTREYYAAMAEAAAKRGVLIEVNTSGLHRPAAELYPAPALLAAFRAVGVGCTIGSDAHTPQDVGRDFDKACKALREAGYHELVMPTRSGERRLVPLDDFEASWRLGKRPGKRLGNTRRH